MLEKLRRLCSHLATSTISDLVTSKRRRMEGLPKMLDLVKVQDQQALEGSCYLGSTLNQDLSLKMTIEQT